MLDLLKRRNAKKNILGLLKEELKRNKRRKRKRKEMMTKIKILQIKQHKNFRPKSKQNLKTFTSLTVSLSRSILKDLY